MLKIIDRYIVREVVVPFFLWLLVVTFVLMMPPILAQGERLIEKGVEWSIIIRVLATLVPQALGVTIPISLLLGILIGLGRLSADREFVALQSCGISIYRILRPVALMAVVAWGVTEYVMLVALPDANQAFRELTFNVVAARAESDVRPRVFFQDFPNRVLYIRDSAPEGGWRDVFMADSAQTNQTTAYFARRGRLVVDRATRTVTLVLEDGTRHTTYLDRPEEYEGGSFDRIMISMDADTVFPKAATLLKGDNEMTITELRARIAEAAETKAPIFGWQFTIQQKFSIPFACVVLALIGLGLGLTNRKDGRLAGFVLGFAVIMAYYFLLWTSRALALSGQIPASLAPWIANIVLGVVGIALVAWRARSADQPLKITLPAFPRAKAAVTALGGSRPRTTVAAPRKVVLVIRVPRIDFPRPNLLDLYITKQYLRVFALGVVGLLGLFYISAFMDLADKLFRGTATGGMMLRFFFFSTPQWIYFIIPMAALISTLVVMGLLTKNSELIVMRACGVSLYRSAVPLVLFSIVLSGTLFEMQERVLAESNRRADSIRHVMRGFPAQTFGVLDRRWIVGAEGGIYHYEHFDPHGNRFSRLTLFDLDPTDWRLKSLTYASDVDIQAAQPADEDNPRQAWHGRDGWIRTFSTTTRQKQVKDVITYAPFTEQTLTLEPPGYFKTDEPSADRMTYGQLKQYIIHLRDSGFHVVPYMVQLQRKVAFPFVTLIMTLLAVPFAVTTGRRGAMYGIGLGIVLAISYWMMLMVFGAVGAGGLIPPVLAAWAPNILFGAAAIYMLLTVRT